MFENFDWIQAMRNSPVMLIILACSVITFGFALERLVYFWRRRGHPDQLLSGAIERVRTGNLKEAAWLCATTPHPVGAVARQVVENPSLGTDAVEEKMQIALSDQKLQLERHLGWLGTMGNTAPLIGLLGTVWGIMRAFHDMARTGSAGPSVVAAGIAEALFTTAAGLLVAVPAVMLYNHFVRRTQVMLTVAENHARTIRIAMDQSRGESRSRPAELRPQTAMFAEVA
ncbi:MAG: MotA/TolQ/ExbB proton channel family protein [Candidatus Eisenbacteria bacterium]|uniref:MotA/TolQ/ExbB proton channel family protein n=1 Tax=Eiseniibacteriota bacterium TaxID=2212470 RepID=A0A538TIB2_UNCEI|nr:MAG: MotA/TolQ/ExbB proton channel family protein [Candidatus Eisenbacteria bacterium]